MIANYLGRVAEENLFWNGKAAFACVSLVTHLGFVKQIKSFSCANE